MIGELKKMEIAAYGDENFHKLIGHTTVLINPSQYVHRRGIRYNSEGPIGKSGTSPKFSGYEDESVNFEVIYDATGVVPHTVKDFSGIKSSIDRLLKVVYSFNSGAHEPNFVQIAWGSFVFRGRMTDCTITYTLFKPDGTPLRASISLAFNGFSSERDSLLRANLSSPDMSHVIRVKEGDTLPLLCYQVYKDPSLYLEVAEFNGLRELRNLTPGDRLVFPPVIN